jgi:hypothetical protein
MGVINGIDYGDLIFSKRCELDQAAYSRYYSDNFGNDILEIDFLDDNSLIANPVCKPPLTYNEWYGTELHKKYVITLLRKRKIEKINKKAD